MHWRPRAVAAGSALAHELLLPRSLGPRTSPGREETTGEVSLARRLPAPGARQKGESREKVVVARRGCPARNALWVRSRHPGLPVRGLIPVRAGEGLSCRVRRQRRPSGSVLEILGGVGSRVRPVPREADLPRAVETARDVTVVGPATGRSTTIPATLSWGTLRARPRRAYATESGELEASVWICSDRWHEERAVAFGSLPLPRGAGLQLVVRGTGAKRRGSWRRRRYWSGRSGHGLRRSQ